jgi:hypothetical protein
MEKSIMGLTNALPSAGSSAQNSFEEYNRRAACYFTMILLPIVITSVMYHVGSKDENPRRQVLPTFRTFII